MSSDEVAQHAGRATALDPEMPGKKVPALKFLGSIAALAAAYFATARLSPLLAIPKIDGSFVRNIDSDLNDRAMVEAIHSVAETLKLRTVAEYVESEQCMNVLNEIGVDYGQGFALGRSRPLPVKR